MKGDVANVLLRRHGSGSSSQLIVFDILFHWNRPNTVDAQDRQCRSVTNHRTSDSNATDVDIVYNQKLLRVHFSNLSVRDEKKTRRSGQRKTNFYVSFDYICKCVCLFCFLVLLKRNRSCLFNVSLSFFASVAGRFRPNVIEKVGDSNAREA